MKESLRFPLVLALVCLGAALGVGGVYALTRGPIAQRKADEARRARKTVSPEGVTDFVVLNDTNDLFKAVDADGKTLGYVATGSARGYGGALLVMCGFDTDLRVLGVVVTSHSETPGLGAELTKVKSNQTLWGLFGLDKSEVTRECWLDQFKGMTGKETDADAGKVDAKTGATITSNAITAAVFQAYQKIEKRLEGNAK